MPDLEKMHSDNMSEQSRDAYFRAMFQGSKLLVGGKHEGCTPAQSTPIDASTQHPTTYFAELIGLPSKEQGIEQRERFSERVSMLASG
mmetsp:Transcript_33807/g.50125  ORF Transcript_33807/g.50125 Transcript_33807/m.50125 type:complete len:88 (-) Transcript_33807:47-310(-)|eukprot:CAMPEP_0194045870 /NCGR_PEP_ID=MMETSP0009_2-20130614/18497_1 /TAXON_ID=210454 /ORGANISM="Grammatophora oceanica, Strain CCMP 410" /LENGTH=87 /DNA_ID=CAMNT_0038690883 /DNA_START=60 /DNA_END=323 /DNA_ORIENTATION=+